MKKLLVDIRQYFRIHSKLSELNSNAILIETVQKTYEKMASENARIARVLEFEFHCTKNIRLLNT